MSWGKSVVVTRFPENDTFSTFVLRRSVRRGWHDNLLGFFYKAVLI
jgi:hypothetical protein